MLRTQILLEEWQYKELKKAAAREKTSMSGAVRSRLSQLLDPPKAERERLKLVGFVKTGRRISGKDHDRHISTKDWDEEE